MMSHYPCRVMGNAVVLTDDGELQLLTFKNVTMKHYFQLPYPGRVMSPRYAFTGQRGHFY